MTARKTLPTEVVEQDRKLDDRQRRSQEALAKHRWHWTLDESNPDRVSVNAYAKSVAVNESTVRRMVAGYVEWRSADSGRTDTTIGTFGLSDYIERAKLGVEAAIAAEAIAKTTGQKLSNVAGNSKPEISEVLTVARDRAERHGTTIEEEIPEVVEHRAKSREAAAKQREDRKAQNTWRYHEIEGHLAYAKRRLRDALEVAKDVDFDDEELELMRDSVQQLRTLLDLLDLRFGGSVGVDWDAELAALDK